MALTLHTKKTELEVALKIDSSVLSSNFSWLFLTEKPLKLRLKTLPPIFEIASGVIT